MIEVADKLEPWIAEHVRLEKGAPGAGLGWVRQLRKAGIDGFAEMGFPTTQHEEWRQTSVARIADTTFRAVASAEARGKRVQGVERFFYPEAEAARLVFVDGHFSPGLSKIDALPTGVKVGTIAQLLAEDPTRLEGRIGTLVDAGSHPFVALNTALFQDGGYVLVEKGVELDRPVHVVYLATADGEPTANGGPTANHPRTVLIAEPRSNAVFMETFAGVGEGASFTNAVTETWIGAEARVHHVMLELATLEAFHMATHQVRLDRGSNLTTHSVSLGGALVRNELNTVLDGEGIWLQMYGMFRVDGTQHIDNHTSIDHPQPHSDSRELYKGLLDGNGKAIFHGKIIVRKDAQLTNAYQENRNLLLSDEAIVDTKPQLEIHANDVKCKHGANIGHVSEDHIHYLRTRGVGREDARRILVHAFGAEMIQQLPVEAVRTRLAGMVYELLGGDPRDAILWGA